MLRLPSHIFTPKHFFVGTDVYVRDFSMLYRLLTAVSHIEFSVMGHCQSYITSIFSMFTPSLLHMIASLECGDMEVGSVTAAVLDSH